MADTGHGATLAFGTSAFTADKTMIAGAGGTRPAINTSHLQTSDYETFVPGDLVDSGEVEFEFHFNPNNQPPITGAAETITITYPIPAGLTNGATAVFSGFVTEWSPGQCKTNELMSATCKIKVSGGVTWTDAS